MDFLKEWVKNIFLIIIGLSFVEIIFPSGNMRKYLKFIMSMMILSIIIFPLFELKNIEISAFSGSDNYFETDDDQMSRLDNVQGVQIAEIYKAKVKEKVTEIIHNKYPLLNVNAVDVYINDDLNKKNFGNISRLIINYSISENINQEIIKAVVSENLNISKDIISIKN